MYGTDPIRVSEEHTLSLPVQNYNNVSITTSHSLDTLLQKRKEEDDRDEDEVIDDI